MKKGLCNVSIYLSVHVQVLKKDYSPTCSSNITLYYAQIFLTLATGELLRYLSEVKNIVPPSNPANYTDENKCLRQLLVELEARRVKAAPVLKLGGIYERLCPSALLHIDLSGVMWPLLLCLNHIKVDFTWFLCSLKTGARYKRRDLVSLAAPSSTED